MSFNVSSLRPTNYGRLQTYGRSQTVTTSEASFISVDEGTEKLMQSGYHSEAQEDTYQVPQESINLEQFFLPGDGKVCIITHVTVASDLRKRGGRLFIRNLDKNSQNHENPHPGGEGGDTYNSYLTCPTFFFLKS